MTISLNLANDWKVFNDPTIVQYASKLTEGPYGTAAAWASPVAVAYVLQRELTKEDVLQDPGLLQGDHGRFHLWAANLGQINPKVGDKITDAAGVLWLVKSIELLDMDGSGVFQRRVCKCLKAVTTN